MNGRDQRTLSLNRFRSYLMVLARTGLHASLRSKMSASDVVQETLLKAQRGKDQMRGRSSGNMAVWLRRILVRVLQDAVRDLHRDKRNVRLERSLDSVVGQSARRLEDLIPADQTSPTQRVARADYLLKVSTALETLPELQRRVILLKHCEGCTLDEIAGQVNRTPAAVASLLRRGLRQVREQVQDD